MTEATNTPAEAPKKKRKAQGPRTVKPLHLLIRVQDENGEAIALNKENTSVEVVKDPATLLEMLTGGDMQGAFYTKFTPAS